MQFDTYKRVYIQMCEQTGIPAAQNSKIYALFVAFRGENRKMTGEAKKKAKTWRAWVAMYILRPIWLYLFQLEAKMRG